MRKIIDSVTWALALILAVPTFLIMASWNSVPGDFLYGVKQVFEQVMLKIVKPSYHAEASLNVHFTERRLNEAKVLIAQDRPDEGLSNLSHQIQATKVVIENAPNKAVQQEVARQYISTLKSVSSELENQKQGMGKGTTVPVTARPTQKSVPTSTRYPGAPTGLPEPTSVIQYAQPVYIDPNAPPVVSEVEKVQQEIDTTIADLERISDTAPPVTPSPEPSPTVKPTEPAEPSSTPQEQRQSNEGPGSIKDSPSSSGKSGGGESTFGDSGQ